MNKLDSFLFEKADVYSRLRIAFEAAEERFWQQLGKELHLIVKEFLGETCRDTFESEEYGKRTDNGYVWRTGWRLDLDGKEWARFPSFWFPEGLDEMDTFALMGIEPLNVRAVIWATPISRYVGDLAWARGEWERAVSVPLKLKGWSSYGENVRTATGQWGTEFQVRLDHREIAKCIEKGELRPALGPIEKAIGDFASVCTGIEEVIGKARARKEKSRRK